MGRFAIEGGVQYLVRWKGFDDSDEDTWEPLDSLLGSAQQAIERFEKAKATTDGASGTDQDDQEYDVKEITGKRTHEGKKTRR